MGLHGQGGDRGYAMAALLIALAIMAILMSVAMPVWRQEARREREAELVWRGEQYARAIALYRNKNNSFPPSIDALVTARFLRQKYKDPMTKEGEFQIVGGTPQPGAPGAPPQGTAQGSASPQGLTPAGGIMGVRSKSQENSLRTYNGATRYDQWSFLFSNTAVGRGSLNPNAQDGHTGTGMPGGRGSGAGRSGPQGSPRGNTPGGFGNPGGLTNPRTPPGGYQPPPFPPSRGGTRGEIPGPGAPSGRGTGRGPGF
jgi:type II secretory pathway pseudopilin PulG